MNLVRKLKISQIISIEFTEIEISIIKFLNEKLSNLTIFVDESNPSKINYMKSDGSCIMQHNTKSDIFWVRYEGFWNVLESLYSPYYSEIQNLLKCVLEKDFKLKVSAPIIDVSGFKTDVELAFKRKITKSNDYL